MNKYSIGAFKIFFDVLCRYIAAISVAVRSDEAFERSRRIVGVHTLWKRVIGPRQQLQPSQVSALHKFKK